MSEKNHVSGSCLCGHVQFEAKGPFVDFRYCHCERCQKSTGGAATVNLWVPKENLKFISGEKDTTLFLHPTADNYGRRFCNKCGGAVPKLARDEQHMLIPGGTLDADPQIKPRSNIFWKLRASWDTCDHGLPTFDERPPKK